MENAMKIKQKTNQEKNPIMNLLTTSFFIK